MSLFIRATISSWDHTMTSSKPNYLPKAPPLNTTILEVSSSTYELVAGRDAKGEKHNSAIPEAGRPVILMV